MSVITVEQIRESVAVARSHGEKFFEQIVWQVENATWTILGYATWDDMRKAEYAGLGVVAPRADRPELVARLRANGLTQQEIADTVGANQSQVSRDLNMQKHNEDRPVAVANARGQQRPASYKKREQPEPEDDVLVGDVHDADAPANFFPTSGPGNTTGQSVQDNAGRDTTGTAETSSLNEFIAKDGEVTRAKKQAALSAAILRSGEVLLWKPEDVLDIADPELLDSIRRFGEAAARWAANITGPAHTLRVINGGGQ